MRWSTAERDRRRRAAAIDRARRIDERRQQRMRPRPWFAWRPVRLAAQPTERRWLTWVEVYGDFGSHGGLGHYWIKWFYNDPPSPWLVEERKGYDR